MSIHKIIEAFYPHLKSDGDINRQSQSLAQFLEIVDRKQPTAKIFMFIYRYYCINKPIGALFEQCAPAIELAFGDDKCCSLRWGVDFLKDGHSIQKRCVGKKSPGFLYCNTHLRESTQVCKSCLVDAQREIVHRENWEHFGNIFDSQVRPIMEHNYKKLDTSANNHIIYSEYLLYHGSKKVVLPKELTEETTQTTKQLQPLINIIQKPLTADQRQIMETALYYYLLKNHIIKPRKLNDQDIIEPVAVYDTPDDYYHDCRFIYKRTKAGLVSAGIYLNADSCILTTGLEERLAELDSRTIIELTEQPNIELFTKEFS